MQWSISRMNTRRNVCANSWEEIADGRKERDSAEGGLKRAEPIDSCFVATAFVDARRERDRSDHCESPGVCTDCHSRYLGLSTCTWRAPWQIDSANLPSPRLFVLHILCEFSALRDLTLSGTIIPQDKWKWFRLKSSTRVSGSNSIWLLVPLFAVTSRF